MRAYDLADGPLTATNIADSATTPNLQGGTVDTRVIVPNTSGGFRLIDLPRCA
jgi:hypothetical protein